MTEPTPPRDGDAERHIQYGLGAIRSMLGLIGEAEATDHDLARLFVANELAIRAVVRACDARDADRLAEIRIWNDHHRTGWPVDYLLRQIDARDAALREARREMYEWFDKACRDKIRADEAGKELREAKARIAALEAVERAGREAYAAFTEHGVPVFKTDALMPDRPYWSPAGRMMDTAPMMALGEALAALDAHGDHHE